MAELETLDLFPMGTTLFPYQTLPMRIFEPRYLKMVGRCHKEDEPFGICLIEEGPEVGPPAIPFHTGTTAVIQSFYRVTDNLYFITIKGNRRFKIVRLLQEVPHIQAEVEWIDEEEPEFPGNYSVLKYSINQLLERIPVGADLKKKVEIPEDNRELLGLVAGLLAGLPQEKQKILEVPTEEFVPSLIQLVDHCG